MIGDHIEDAMNCTAWNVAREQIRQQYLDRVPHGYRCHANTGIPFPATA